MDFFGKIAVLRVLEDDYISRLKVFFDSQDHLAEVLHQRHQGVGQEQGHPQKYFLGELQYQELLRMITWVFERCFWTARNIWLQSSTKDTKV